MMRRILVIGTGPAGLMAALSAVRNGQEVLVLEKNEVPGRKLSISGSGQCNLTHTGEIVPFSKHYGEKVKEAYQILKRFSNHNLINFFHQLGLKLIQREDGKYFPQSFKSKDVITCLINALTNNHVQIIYGSQVCSIQAFQDYFIVDTKSESYQATKVICATGGYTYPKTGSDGSFFAIVKKLGHRIVPLGKGLSPIITEIMELKQLSGISIQNAGLRFRTNTSNQISKRGELLITHRGFSGPLIIDHSRHFSSGMSINLNFTSFENAMALEKDLIRYAMNNGKKSVMTYFDDLRLPKRLVTALFQLANIDGSINLSQLSKENRKKVSEQFASFKVTIRSLGNINESMVTTGGIDLKEIKLSTMESKKVKGVHFCGEMIDIDGDTGGYNIQMCFSTGFIAGMAASKGE